MINISYMKEAYGERWAYFMPPTAEPFVAIENLQTPDDAESRQEYRSAPVQAQPNEVLVIQTYGVTASAAVPNPYWPGLLPTRLPAEAFQGRVTWTVKMGDREQDYYSKLSNVTYQNGAPAAQFALGYKSKGISLLQTFGVGDGYPPIIVEPGARAYITLNANGATQALDNPPAQAPQPVYTSVLSGYRVRFDPLGAKKFAEKGGRR